jgi:cytochrome b subunit of formate dehydrogenase
MREPEGRSVKMLGSAGVVFALLMGFFIPSEAAAVQADPQDPGIVTCDSCHEDRAFLAGKADTPEHEAALFVPDSILIGTRHEGEPRSCGSCHEAEGRDWAASIHAPNGTNKQDAPTCVTCHTAHRVYGADDSRSPTYPFNVATLCGECHGDPNIIGEYFQDPEEAQARVAVEQYYETVHGWGLVSAGLVTSATCNDCHESHKVLPASSPESSVHRANVVNTCGNCHVGIVEAYEEGSAHGAAYRAELRGEEGEHAPACVDCHTSHSIVEVDEPRWFVGVVEECGKCHEDVYDTYFDTYHGQVTRLGAGLTAKCSDCHTAHNMRPTDDPQSSVYPMNLVKTCSKCHPGANQNFVRYYAHGDNQDRERYPVLFWSFWLMTTLLVSVWSFFTIHSILWFIRLKIEIRRRRKAQGGRARRRMRLRLGNRSWPLPWPAEKKLSAADRGSGPYVWRFSGLERILHLMVIVSFFGLVITGIPLLYSHTAWARLFIWVMGGFQAAGLIHRICAVLTFAYFFIHVGDLTVRMYRSENRKGFFWGPDSMIVQPKDLRDATQMFKWFFGRAPQPRFDRFNYMDKLDYWGEFWGIMIIGGSGLILWFPTFFSYFLPGWVFNVATIVHGIEALLAAGIIFSIHFFNVNLRPEKFPVDIVMFTGRARLDYLKEERPLEYERLEKQGAIEDLIAPPPSRAAYLWSVTVGLIAVTLGTLLIWLIIAALITGGG